MIIVNQMIRLIVGYILNYSDYDCQQSVLETYFCITTNNLNVYCSQGSANKISRRLFKMYLFYHKVITPLCACLCKCVCVGKIDQ